MFLFKENMAARSTETPVPTFGFTKRQAEFRNLCIYGRWSPKTSQYEPISKMTRDNIKIRIELATKL